MSDEEDDDVIIACTSVIIACAGIVGTVALSQKKKRKHRFWVREFICDRDKYGLYNSLLPQLYSTEKFHQYLRMETIK
jgi:hypothetical protein